MRLSQQTDGKISIRYKSKNKFILLFYQIQIKKKKKNYVHALATPILH